MEGDGRRIRREPELNDLPDGVLDNIVSRLSIQEAVRAAVVAKPWRHCWKLTRELGFDGNFYNEFIRGTNYRLDAVVKSVLSRHIGPIRKFNLYIPPHIPANDASFDVSEEMSILSEKKVEHLSFYVCNRTHLEVPASIYNFSDLEHLDLQRCQLSDSTSFNGFPKLESIKLSNVIVPDNILGSMLSLSPKMAQIDMECFNDGNPVELHQAAVENLEAIFYHCMARAVRPLRLTRLPSMKCASFETQLQLPGRPSRITSSLEYFPSLLPRVEDLYLDAAAILSLYEEDVPRTLVTPLGCLKTLAFEYIDIGSYPMLSVAFCLMRSAPNLESLEINIEPDQRLAVHAAARNFLNEQLKLPPLMTTHILFFKNLLNTGIEMKLIQTLIKLSPRLKAILFRSSTDIARDTERKMHRKLRRIRLPEGARFNFEWAWQELR